MPAELGLLFDKPFEWVLCTAAALYRLLPLRHVMLPKDIAKKVPRNKLLTEAEWRQLGVQQSQGWIHYMVHGPEPHILLFRRALAVQPRVY